MPTHGSGPSLGSFRIHSLCHETEAKERLPENVGIKPDVVDVLILRQTAHYQKICYFHLNC